MQRFRVLIRPIEVSGERFFVAQCLERNIAVQGQTPPKALDAFMEHVIQIRALVKEHGAEDPFAYLDEAPHEAWQAWHEAFRGQTATVPDESVEIETALAYAC